MSTTSKPGETAAVILTGDEVLLARTAVRKCLQKVRNNYRHAMRREGREHFARTHLRRFDDYLDLYERLGGNPDDVIDPETDDAAMTERHAR